MATSPDFEATYRKASEEQRCIVTAFIADGDKDAVQQWLAIQERDRTNIEELPVKELRKLAGSLGIPDYQYMTKASLLSSISTKGISR